MSGDGVSGNKVGRLLAFGVMGLGAALASSGFADRAAAADRRGSSGGVIVSEMNDVQRVKLVLNKSRTFKVDTAFATIVAGSSDIVDVKSLSDHLIYVQGKQTGTTNVILFDSSMKQIGILDVEVVIDTGNLQQNIRPAPAGKVSACRLPRARWCSAGSRPTQLRPSGPWRSPPARSRKGVVVNAMSVAAPQQVMLEVRFLEVNREAGRNLGVNLYAANANGTNVGNTGLGRVTAAGRSPIGGINTANGPLGAGEGMSALPDG